MRDLGEVGIVTSCCIVAVLFFGSFYDNFIKERHVVTVPCSVTIQNMARKLNVTLMDECEISR